MNIEEEFKRLETENKWDEHYEMIDKKSRIHSSEVGSNNSNHRFNRYLDVRPYDKSRVKLLGLDGNDYINANLVKVPKAGRQYILTQGPLSHTISHFWLMVWEQKSSVIVMLNNVIEMEAYIKCELYWPDSTDKLVQYPDVDLEVTLKSVQNLDHYCIREMLLVQSSTQQSRTVHQLHYNAWPDHDEPSSPTSFLRLLSAVRKMGALDKMDEPAIVHCSAGIGRSGTFCLIDSILTMVENQGTTEGIDIVNTLLELRDYRKGLIQSPVQLRFSYMAIIYGIKILERANMLQPHISSIKDSKPSEKSQKHKTTDPGPSTKKPRRSRKKQPTPSTSSNINIFKRKHSLVEALDDIDSDSADNLVYLTTTLPTFKKAKSDDTTSPEQPTQPPQFTLKLPSVVPKSPPPTTPTEGTSTKFQFLNTLLSDYTISTVESSSSTTPPRTTLPPLPTTPDSVYVRRRQRELKNQQLAEKTQEIKNKMKIEEMKREQQAKRMAILKKSAIVGGVVALLLSSALYVYFQDHSSS